MPSTDTINRYQIILERAADHRYHARCAEIPSAQAASSSIDRAVERVRAAIPAHLARMTVVPEPLRETQGPLGAWLADIEVTHALPPVEEDFQAPVPSALHAIAQWTTERYRLLIEEPQAGRFVAASVEMPEFIGCGATPRQAVDELRRSLEDAAYEMLGANQTPPEPIQDIEGRMQMPQRREKGAAKRMAA